jgi:hypothetical protein
VHIPYTLDLTEAGNLYACRCLALDLVQASNLDLAPLRRLSAEIAADLSLRHYLAQEHVSYNTLGAEPFSHPDRNEIILGKRLCHLANTSIGRKAHIDRVKGNPALLLSAPASVPEAALTSERWGYQDLLIFALTLAMPKLARGASGKAQTGDKADHFIYVLPGSWRKARLKGESFNLAIQSACDGEIALELGGQAGNHDFISQTIRLPSRQSVRIAQRFTRLAYISIRHMPTATISLHDPGHQHPLHITPDRWGNLGVDGIEIILVGYIEAGEFRRRAQRIRPSARPWEFDSYPSPGFSLPMQDLLPLPGLITWLRNIQESG